VYKIDALARRDSLSPEERLRLHRKESAPLMEKLREWMLSLLAERKVEPNSGLGKAIRYMENHWEGLTQFLRTAGAPLDNNITERALKRAILHRKSALFYKTLNGARVGDIFMSLIYTAELEGVNAFDYLVTLLRHPREVAERPGQWMPWEYRATLARLSKGPDPPA
ncbi:MAG: IS66 family transposase, partial [Steroidobacteraceae bacterium]